MLLSSCVMSVYVVSGPPASGKSTVSERLAGILSPCALISGDLVHHMIFSGRRPPWVDGSQAKLTWRNIACIAKNFVGEGYRVVVDYVCYPHEAEWLVGELEPLGAKVKYVVLMARSETLMGRDTNRVNQMGSRVLEVYKELLSSVDGNHILNTDELSVEQAVSTIITSEKFILSPSVRRTQ